MVPPAVHLEDTEATVATAVVKVTLLLDDYLFTDPITDSTAGKLMEKVGGMLGNEKMAEKGAEKRAQAGGNFDNSGSGSYGGDNSNY